MTTLPDPGGYPLPPEDVIELTRLIQQGEILTQATEGSVRDLQQRLPPQCKMIDLGCGPAELILSVAVENPGWQIIGLDKNKLVLDWAEHKRKADHLNNVSFQLGDITQPLPFADASFDLIFGRTLVGILGPSQWLPFLSECFRILRPSGVLRLIEMEWSFFSGENAAALEKMIFTTLQGWHRAGRSFSPNGYAIGITALLESFVEQAGFEEIQEKAFTVNYRAGKPAHEPFLADFQALFPLAKPYLLKFLSETEVEEYDNLARKAVEDMAKGGEFFARSFLLQVSATRRA